MISVSKLIGYITNIYCDITTNSYSTNHVYLHMPNAFGFWQMRLHLH